MINKNKIAGIEIHNGLLIEQYAKEFDYNFIKESIQKINGISPGTNFRAQYVIFGYEVSRKREENNCRRRY